MKTLIVVLLSCLLQSCSVAGETTCTYSSARVTYVQCDFGHSLCGWKNDAKGISWYRPYVCTHGWWNDCRRGYYAKAAMDWPSPGKKARLVSSQLCSTGFIYYQLKFNYVIDCASDQCRLSVILRSDFNDSEQVLWESTTERTQWQGYRNDTIQPEAGDFTIIFQAEKVGNYHWSSYIGIDNISFEPAGSVGTITPSTSTAAHPTTQTTTKAFTSTTMVAQRTDKQTTALTEQTSSKHVSSFGGTSLQTSPTWAGDSDTQKENDGKDSDAGVIVGVAVSVIVVIVVVAAAIVILIFMRRRRNDKGSLHLLHCLKRAKKPKTTAEHLRPGVINAAYSQGDDIIFAPDNADHLYAQVKKPKAKARNANNKHTADGNSAANTTKPDTALYQVATVPVGELKNGEDGDYNTVGGEVARNSFPSENGKDSGYELATASQTTAVHGGAKASLGGNNAHIQEQNEYNKLSHQPPHTAPSGPRTDHAYDHLAEQKQGVPPEQTAGGVYSLAKIDDFADGLSRSRKGKDDYINVNSDLTTTQSSREAEYNRLDFDDDHPRGPAAGGHVAGRARDVYNHLQAGAEGSQGPGDGDQYNSLDFDGQDHKQQVIEGAEYSHLASEDA